MTTTVTELLTTLFNEDHEGAIYLSEGRIKLGTEPCGPDGKVIDEEFDTEAVKCCPFVWTVRRCDVDDVEDERGYKLKHQGTLEECLEMVMQNDWHNDPLPSDGGPNAYADIILERQAQDAQWGGPTHDDHHVRDDWYSYINKQLTKLTLHPGPPVAEARKSWREGLIKIAALAIAAIEAHDREDARRTAQPRNNEPADPIVKP